MLAPEPTASLPKKTATRTELEEALVNISRSCRYGLVVGLLILVLTIVYDRTVPQTSGANVIIISGIQTSLDDAGSNSRSHATAANAVPVDSSAVAVQHTQLGREDEPREKAALREMGDEASVRPVAGLDDGGHVVGDHGTEAGGDSKVDAVVDVDTGMNSSSSKRRLLEPTEPYKHTLSKRAIRGNPDDLHFVFSTDCTNFMTWQTEVFAHHFYRYMPDIPLTRLVSGECEEGVDLKKIHNRWPSMQFHYCEDARKGPAGTDNWRFYNKPFAVTSWLKNVELEESMIVLLDMDMIVFKPFDLAQMQREYNWEHIPKKGHPAGMNFGYYVSEWTKLPQCQSLPECKALFDMSAANEKGREYVQSHYTPGPPYIIHKDDLSAITKSWYQIGYEVREYKKSLGKELGNNDEMFGFSISAAKLQLPFMQSRRFSLSAADGPVYDFEDWPEFERGDFFPYVMHYCQYYSTDQKSILKDPKAQAAAVNGQFSKINRFVKYDWGFSTTELDGFLAKPFQLDQFLECPGNVIDPSTGISPAKKRNNEHLVKPHVREIAYGRGHITAWQGHTEQHPKWRQLFMANTIIANLNAAILGWQEYNCGSTA